MAALQQSPVALQAKTPLSARVSGKTLASRPIRLSFSGSFSSLKLPKLAAKTRFRRGAGAAGATMLDTAAASYASALAEVAKSNGTLDSTSADMEKVEKVFKDSLVYDFFANPTIRSEKKSQVIDEIAQSSSLQPHTANFLKILVDMKRIELVKDIVKEFELFYNKLTNTELAIVTSVVPLESQHLAQIAKGVQRLTGAKNVRIKTVLDPSLVAGFTIRYGNSGSKLIDMSVKKQLEEIASQLDFSEISLV
ncbi:PREDICTED: ATP synthase delta chain, chloroplastic [Nelumbo nucifera]|uniref:ATP synthase delta chain, chloroplastic n=2 Tax=Nelumbo nucifera TaxID=4432 RepID=A0A822Y953_NELNU|nr:PREDICTED: ATP synthase delta chain, chloroplastic [Nelumbo nucifera]DAD29050.1 TPA_asm: hypothetical protein HUJ06_030518 [Nelumbo nucifera]